MQSKKITKLASLGIKTLSLAVASCVIYSASNAAGLGKLSVLSALGQPLRAEIELTSVSNGDISNLVPRLASYSEFQQAHIDYNQELSSLRFALEDRDSKHFVLITSTQAMNQPLLELLVELNSANGRLVREYNLLLEPAEVQANHASINEAAIMPVQHKIALPSTVSTPGKSRKPVHVQTESKSNFQAIHQENKTVGYYKIKSGDTLTEIARQFKYEGISLEQMLVAIQRSNPSVFINNNMNLIRSGDMVMIPEISEVQRIDQSDAKKVIAAHSADFNAYRNKLADQVAEMPPEESTDTKKINSGKITAKVVEPSTPDNESKDKLKLSKAGIQERAELLTLEEENIAQQIELEVANDRIKELEQNTANLKKILDLQNGATSSPTTANNTDTTANAPILPISPAIESTVSVPSATQSEQPPIVAAPLITPEQNGAINWLSYLPYGAILLALLVAAGAYFSRRKKVSPPKLLDERRDSVSTVSAISASRRANLLPRARVNDSPAIDNADDLPLSDLTSSSDVEVNETDPAVDPITQADAYIAHGRYQQAEELLNEAIRAEPNRQLLRVKLLEIYAHHKDTRSFEAMARKIYEMTGGHGADWEKVAAMGVIVDPQMVVAPKDQVATPAITPLAKDAVSEQVKESPSQPTASENLDTLGLESDGSTPNPEPLIQVETKPRTADSTSEVPQSTVSPDRGFTDIDFSGIDLDLPKMPAEVNQDKPKFEKVVTPTATPHVVSEQVSTKLDLAMAYQKIGDKDGARQLLSEVLQAGNQEQVAAAKTMMSELV